MFGEIKVTRWALLLAIVLIIAVSNATNLSRSQVVGPREPAPILTGLWTLDTGETISISQDASGSVTAEFKPHVRCLSNSTRKILFTAPLKRTSSGEFSLESDIFWACTRTPAMVTECRVQELFQTKFKATVSPFGITGEVLRPHYDYDIVNGRRTNCTRNEKEDGWAPFSLTPLCRPSTPWFDIGPGCDDAKLGARMDQGFLVVFICDTEIQRLNLTSHSDELVAEYVARFTDELSRQVGGAKVCCQKFHDAVRTGQPCNPSVDVDCDGKPNNADLRIETPGLGGLPSVSFPDINVFSTPPGAYVDPFPEALPQDRRLVPPSSGCDCKWQLIKGALTCGAPDQQHTYVATWKCPTSGREVVNTNYAPPNTPCP